jgi:hypothetical protein
MITAIDAAGNLSGNYVVLSDALGAEVTLDAANIGDFNLQTVNLLGAEQANLTITAEDLANLNTDNTVTVQGGADDSVTITGATPQGTDASGDYNVYELGDGTLFIDTDITDVTT